MQVSDKLKALRGRSGLSVRKMAEALDMKPSSYQHYEDKYKREHFDPALIEQFISVLVPRGVPENEIRDMGYIGPAAPASAEAPQNLDLPIPEPTEGSLNNPRVFFPGNGTVRLSGTFDDKGLVDLAGEIENMRNFMRPKD